MKLYRDEAVVLRGHKLGEADRILTLLTRHNGQVRAVAKGIRRTNSKWGGRAEPFGVIQAQLYQGRNLDILTQAESIAAYGPQIAADYTKYTAAAAMVEVAERLTKEDGHSPQPYLLLVGALHALATGRHRPNLVLDSYLLRSLALAGWAPSCYDCAHCGKAGPHQTFSVAGGGVLCPSCAHPGLPKPALRSVQLLGELLSGNWEEADASPTTAQNEVSGLVAAYTQWQLENRLRSFALLEVS